jgi:hypothetical protein
MRRDACAPVTGRLAQTLAPGAGNVITHGHEEHYREPKNGGDDYELCALWAVFAVHKKEDDKRSFEHSDGERDDYVEPGEIPIQVYLGGENGQDCANHEGAKDAEIDFG